MCDIVSYILSSGLFFFFLSLLSLFYFLFLNFNLYLAHFANYNYLYVQNSTRQRSGVFFMLKLVNGFSVLQIWLHYSFLLFLY